MDDEALLRYSRHILLDEIGIEGQLRLLSGRVLIVGMGGLGAPAAMYLAAAGVGQLILADGDEVDLTNLQRQIIHLSTAIGQNKAVSAADTLSRLQPLTQVTVVPTRLTADTLSQWIDQVDVVLDCSDNFTTRHAINRVCTEKQRPLVSGAAISFAGQLSVFDTRRADSPCYHCLFPAEGNAGGQNCATFGVVSPLVGVIGSLQALEAVKLLADCGTPLVGKLQMFDALGGNWQTLAYGRDTACPVCADRGH